MLLTNIFDSFDTRANLTWEQQDIHELTGFIMGNYWIVIQILRSSIDDIPVLQGKNTAEVSFWAQDPQTGKISHEALNVFNPTQSLQILSIVMHALLEKFENYDAFLFTAEKRYSDYSVKSHLYEKITNKLAKNFNFFPFIKDTRTAKEFVISKIQFKVTECGRWSNSVLEFVHYDLKPLKVV